MDIYTMEYRMVNKNVITVKLHIVGNVVNPHIIRAKYVNIQKKYHLKILKTIVNVLDVISG
jgi:hypothetical protein